MVTLQHPGCQRQTFRKVAAAAVLGADLAHHPRQHLLAVPVVARHAVWRARRVDLLMSTMGSVVGDAQGNQRIYYGNLFLVVLFVRAGPRGAP